MYRNKFSTKFKRILSTETKVKKEQSFKVFKLKNADIENLIFQRMSELLFKTYTPPTPI
jgi:hypothetical protein